ncbi:hypothetical protein V8C35DRAFT_295003 [Trichoderma chlorosporum]
MMGIARWAGVFLFFLTSAALFFHLLSNASPLCGAGPSPMRHILYMYCKCRCITCAQILCHHVSHCKASSKQPRYPASRC